MKKLLYILLFVPVALFAQDNYSLSFDGVDDYLEINNIDITHTNSFTWQIYIRFNQDVNIALFNQYEYYSTNGYYINYYDNRLCFSFASAGGVANNQVWSEQNVIQINNWNLLTVVKNEDSIYHYVNGVDVTSGNNSIQHFPESYIHSIENINIGWSGENSDTQEGNQWLKGEVDRISFWNTSLTDEEIQLYMMCPPTGQEDGLVGYWNFNEGLGDSLYDISGNGNQGTIYGATFSEDVPEETCSILDQLNASFDAWNISIDLSAGWNMFGYGCPTSIDLVQGLSSHTELIAMVKDNNGSAYIPEFDFNGIGDLTPGFGYQIKVTEAIEGFSLCDWYVNDIPEDNIVSLQEEVASLQAEFDSIYGCLDENACNYDALAALDDGSCYDNDLGCGCDTPGPIEGFNCDGIEVIGQIGDTLFGGIVFYVDETGEHGLVAAMEDLTEGATDPYGLGFNGYEWGCFEENVNGADGQSIGTGYQNTMDIVNQGCVTLYGGITAAQAALDAEINGYSDWYLPSKDELSEMYSTIGNEGLEGNIGGFDTSDWPYYWSSSEYDFNAAWSVSFADGNTGNYAKFDAYRVRVIRAF